MLHLDMKILQADCKLKSQDRSNMDLTVVSPHRPFSS